MMPAPSARQRLAELRQAAADAKGRVDGLLARATEGKPVSGADLAAARANLEIAEIPIPGAEAAAAVEQEAERSHRNSEAADRLLEAETVTKQAFIDAADVVRDALRQLKEVADQHAQLVAWGVQQAHDSQPGDRLGHRLGGIAGAGGVTLLVDRRAIPGAISYSAWVARLQTEVLGTAGAPDPSVYPIEAAQS